MVVYRYTIGLSLSLLLMVLGTGCQAASQSSTATATTSASAATLQSTVSPKASPTATATPASIFGVELSQLSEAGGLLQARNANALWVRRAGVWWPDVEPVEGERRWEALAGMEAEFEAASASGARIILVVRGVPTWAQAKPGHACGPIAADKLPAFADFMAALVARYSVSPYSVLYWELGNEPDVAPELVAPDSPFGCWGDDGDSYYGGGYYAEMLKAVYPAIKAAAPEAQVLIGGLLLDCNPDLPDRCTNDRPPRFLEGILRGGGGPFFDGVSFHAYDYYGKAAGVYANYGWDSAWNTTGPAVQAKARFIRATLAQYGASEKYLIDTESALICGGAGDEPECQTQAFADTKASYVAQVYATALAAGLRANVWYSFYGWRGSGLMELESQSTPAYLAFQFATNTLGSARFVRTLDLAPGLSGYEFEQANQRLWVLWSRDGLSHSVPLAIPPASVFSMFGEAVAPLNEVSVTQWPVYIEWETGP